MWIWNFVLWLPKRKLLGSFYASCGDAANYYADIYRYLGYFFLGVLLIGLFALICSKIRPKDNITDGFSGLNVMSDPNDPYGKNRLNPYGNYDGKKQLNNLTGDKKSAY